MGHIHALLHCDMHGQSLVQNSITSMEAQRKSLPQMKFSLALGIQIFLLAEGNPQGRSPYKEICCFLSL